VNIELQQEEKRYDQRRLSKSPDDYGQGRDFGLKRGVRTNSGKKGKGKAYLYSAFHETSAQGAQGCPCKLHHTCLYLANVRQMAPSEWQTSNSSSLLIYRLRKDERLSWPSWLT